MRNDNVAIFQFNHVKLQYKRLQKHFNGASKEKDLISFLDLSHTLRIWVEMKKMIDSIIENSKENIRFVNPVNSRPLKKMLKNSDNYSISFTNIMDDNNFAFGKLLWINKVLSKDEIDQLTKIKPPLFPISSQTELRFSEWLGSTIIKVPSNKQSNSSIDISREMLIKRVANILGSSHPIGTDFQEDIENKFDVYIRNLHALKISDGLPITYYLLLEISYEIIWTLKKIFNDSAFLDTHKKND